MDFLRALGNATRRNAFACTRISVPKDNEYEFLISNDDRAVVWIDGREVYKSEKSGPAGRSRRLVKIKLTKGHHTILVRVFQRERQWVFKVEPLSPAGITGLPFAQW